MWSLLSVFVSLSLDYFFFIGRLRGDVVRTCSASLLICSGSLLLDYVFDQSIRGISEIISFEVSSEQI